MVMAVSSLKKILFALTLITCVAGLPLAA